MNAEKLKDLNAQDTLGKAGEWARVLLPYAIAICAVLVVVYVVLRILSRRRRVPIPEAPDLSIDVASLPVAAPSVDNVGLLFHNVPVRLAAIVLAPAGRVHELPPSGDLHGLFDSLYPGLSGIVAKDQPLIRRWPPQISIRGFAHQFFSNARLPGQGGPGSPWCSIAGVVRHQGQPVLVGLIFRTPIPTNLGQKIVEQQAQWLGMFQIRG